jgi:phosphate transport system substrate-binding protein
LSNIIKTTDFHFVGFALDANLVEGSMAAIEAYQKSRIFLRSAYVLTAIAFLLLCACSPSDPSSSSLSGHLLVVGSTALQPLTTVAASLFQKDHPQVHIEVRGGGSLFGLDAISNQQTDIGESDVYADPALYPDPNLTDHIVCIVPFTLIVNLDVSTTLTSLRQEQITAIFATGKLQNWSELGGPNLPIVPVVRSDPSGTRASFVKYVLGGMHEQKHALPAGSSKLMLQTVADTPGAIGYLGLAYLDASVRPLAINGQNATPEAIATGTYAFWGYEHMYTMSNNHKPAIDAFLQFMLSATIQEQAKRLGYIPLTQVQLPATVPRSP